jgi:hypothetical protein
MPTRARIVVDSNVPVSRRILPESICAQSNARLLISEATMYELADYAPERSLMVMPV